MSRGDAEQDRDREPAEREDPTPAALVRIESLSAVTFHIRDMPRAVGFYDALGFEKHYGGASAAFTSYRIGDGHLNLQLRPQAAAQRVWGRTIFYVSDVDGMHARALAAGFQPEFEPRDAAWGERYFHLRDPDGYELSFARPLSPAKD